MRCTLIIFCKAICLLRPFLVEVRWPFKEGSTVADITMKRIVHLPSNFFLFTQFRQTPFCLIESLLDKEFLS